MQSIESLYEVICSRREQAEENSYTAYLFDQGLDKILKKVGEESAETVIAAKNKDPEELTNELADLVYHLLVLMANENLPLSALDEELRRRSEKIGNKKAVHQVDRNS